MFARLAIRHARHGGAVFAATTAAALATTAFGSTLAVDEVEADDFKPIFYPHLTDSMKKRVLAGENLADEELLAMVPKNPNCDICNSPCYNDFANFMVLSEIEMNEEGAIPADILQKKLKAINDCLQSQKDTD